MNVVGGYVVTGRMLKMFRKRPAVPVGAAPAAVAAAANGAGNRRLQHAAARTVERSAAGTVRMTHLRLGHPADLRPGRVLLRARPAPDEQPGHAPRRGNQVSTAGMITAIAATLAIIMHGGRISATGWIVMIAGALVGGAAGLYSARTVQMTAMPQLVSMFNAVGGGAAALVGIHDYMQAGVVGLGDHVGDDAARRDHRRR